MTGFRRPAFYLEIIKLFGERERERKDLDEFWECRFEVGSQDFGFYLWVFAGDNEEGRGWSWFGFGGGILDGRD